MNHWLVSTEPEPEYVAWAQAVPRAFAAPSRASAIAALGARPLFAWNSARRVGVLLAVFERGPVRVGMFGQPVAGPAWDVRGTDEVIADALVLARAADLDMIRVNLSMQMAPDPGMVAARQERWIADLRSWQVDADRRRRKDLAFARRADGGVNRIERGVRAAEAHSLCAAAVARHGGSFRYSEGYFAALAAKEGEGTIKTWSARAEDGAILGVAVLAVHEDCGYYLHGAANANGRRAGVADLLLEAVTAEASAVGCSRLTLMASPWNQPGLVAFKDKWSDSRGYYVTHDVAASTVGRAARAVIRWRSRGERIAFQAQAGGPK